MHMTVPHDPAADGSDAMEVTIERLRERIAELERALGRHEQNASVTAGWGPTPSPYLDAAHTTTREASCRSRRRFS